MSNKWYSAGLHFECLGCGNCCAGPAAGYIWVSSREILLIANYLKITADQLKEKYIKRIVLRTSIIENPQTNDCIFLRKIEGSNKCLIYPVRPNQCRTWPFWQENLNCPDSWNNAAKKCPGINRGSFFRLETIEKLEKQKTWWNNEKHSRDQSQRKENLRLAR